MQKERLDPNVSFSKNIIDNDFYIYFFYLAILFFLEKKQEILISKISLSPDVLEKLSEYIFNGIYGEQLKLLIGIYIIATLVSLVWVLMQSIFFYKKIKLDLIVFYRSSDFFKYILFVIVIGFFYILAARMYFEKETIPYDLFVLLSDSTVLFFMAYYFVLLIKHLIFFITFSLANKGV